MLNFSYDDRVYIILGVGFMLFCIPTILMILEILLTCIWEWVDDGDSKITFIQDRLWDDWYVLPSGLWVKLSLGLASLPSIFLICNYCLAVPLIVLVIWLLLVLARFTRRLSKKFKLHEKDVNAHKKETK